MGWIKGLLDNTREDIRESLAQFYSLVIAEMDEKEFERTMADLTRSFKEKGLEMQHGIVLALGYSFGRRILKLRKTNAPEKKFREWGSFKTSSELLLAQLSNHHSLMLGGACSAVAEIGRCGPLPLADSGPEDEVKNKLGVVKKLLAMMKSAKNGMRVREKATMALGQICIGDPEFPHRRLVLEECLESAQEIKDLELHFTMGEAIVYAAIGPLSPAARDLWQVKEEDFKPDYGSHGTDHIEWVIDQLCNKYTMSTHPNVKQGSCLWLLALTKHGKHIKSVQDRMLLIQSSFMYLLGDANDLVQDAASKGLGLVYDSCSEEQQDKMVKNLLGTLMEGNRSVAKVSGETKIFEEGSMSKTPTGENLNTYKELCSLATDLNQPDLVYKFMHLANYNSMWNSRKGAAFGFSTIATKAGEQLEEHLHKIVPKLYRYQFDPTPKIQESMTSIWNALVPESTKTVDKYLPQIIEEIHTNLTSNQWRVRESCCMALHDLLRGRTLDDALDHVPGLWADIFRLMDDIKETVRTAANKAAGSLSRTSIRMCDIAQGAKSGQAAIKVVMPPLLEKGLASTVAEVRSIVLATIVKITRSAGEVLKPHLPLLIPALLEATSELESKEMNYLSVKLANDVSVQEKLDLARIQSAKSSPMMECVNFVLQYVDAPILEQLVPRIIELIKGNVGIGTKGTTAHLVTTLTHQCPLDLQQYTGKILAAFVSGLTDRNAAVRKTYAEAIGYLMKTAKDSSMEKLFVKLRTWYIEKDDDTSKWAVAYTLDAINKYNPDKLKSNATQAVPLTFLAMHEQPVKGENDGILEIWEEVWSDITPGTEGGIRIFLVEIMALLSLAIESTQWKMKAQAARAMGTIASKLGNSLPMKDQGRLLTILINALSGRTWDGKEAILTALADVCSHSPETVHCLMEDKVNGLSIEILMTCLLKECKKEKMSYKLVALSAVGRIMKEMKLEYFPALYEMGFPVIRMEMEEDEHGEMRPKQSEEELDDDKDERDRKLELRHAIYECLGNAWPTQASLQEKYFVEMLKSLYARVLSTTRKNQLCITKCLGEMIGKWKAQSASAELRSEVFVQVAKILSVVLVVPKSSQLRTQALSVLSTAIKLLVGCLDSQLVLVFRNEIAKSLEDVIRDVSSDAATKAMAREIRTALLAINDEASDPPEEKMEEE